MKSINRILKATGWFLFVNMGIALCSADVPPVRIMPLGDSITQGCCSGSPAEGGYRNRLHTLLTGAGFNVDFVGTMTDPNNPGLADKDHQGVPAVQIDGIRSAVGMWLKEGGDPDVILLHVGTNDFTGGATVTTVENRLKELIADLSALRPHAKILVTSPILRTDLPAIEALQAAFAQGLPQLVSEQAGMGRHVHFVDLHGVLDPDDLNDGIHPNTGGYEKMADAWLPAINAVITPLGTSQAPAIASIDTRLDLEHIVVCFSKPVEDAAAVASNFNISGGVTVLNAELDVASKRLVTLTTSPQSPGMMHTLSVSGVRDRTPQHNLIQPQSIRTFTSRSVVDGSFEASAQGWAASGNSLVANASLPATNGTSVVVFNGGQTSPNGILSQTIVTTPGQRYRLEFDMGVNDATGTNSQSLEFTVLGNIPLVSQTETLNGLGSGGIVWVAKSYEFVADSSSTVLTFRDVSAVTSNVDLLLDDVRLNIETNPVLTVTSAPSAGLAVVVSPLDTLGNGNGTTDFSRTYGSGATVNLTAPATFGGKTFEKWQKNGVNYSTSAATSVTMDASHSMTAVYKTLLNGSFEQGSGGPGSLLTLDGWTVTGSLPYPPFGYLADAPNYVPSEGGRLVVFNGGGSVADGAIQQTFDTVLGQTYEISFDAGINVAAGNQQRAVTSVIDGEIGGGGATLLAPLAAVVTASGTQSTWLHLSGATYQFTAASARTTLIISDGTAALSGTPEDVSDLLVDNVLVSLATPRTLTVNSTPTTGVSVTVSPADSNGNGSGVSNFTRTYVDGSLVTLTAPGVSGAGNFQKWQKDSVDLTTSPTTVVTMDANHTLTAVYLVNTAPAAVDDSYSATTDVALTVAVGTGVLANDTDAEFNSLTAVQVAGPSHGGLSLNSNGGFTYTPTPGYSGPDSFTYKANDGALDSNVATVSITVTAGGANLLANGSFELGNVVVGGGGPGSVTNVDSWTPAGAQFGYVGTTQYPASHLARLLVFNGGYLGGDDSFTGSVAQSFATTIGQTYTVTLDVGIYSQGVNGKNQRLEVKVDGSGNLQTVQIPLTSTAGPEDVVEWSLAEDFTFVANSVLTTLTLRDNTSGLSNTSASDLVVDNVRVVSTGGPVNTAPVASAESYAATRNTLLTVPVAGVLINDTDAESNPLTAIQVSAPSHGSLSLAPNGSFTYQPTSGYTGPDSFTYKANDGGLDSNTVTVSITVNVPVLPSLTNGSFELGSPVDFGTLADWEVSGAALTAVGYGDHPPDYDVKPGNGDRLLLFNAGGNDFSGEVSQTFTTVPGQTYTLSLDMGISGVALTRQYLLITVTDGFPGGGGATLLSQPEEIEATGLPTKWANPKPSTTFVAASTTTTLKLSDTSGAVDGSFSDLLIDNVRVDLLLPPTAPVAVADSYTTVESTPLIVPVIGVLSNDTDANSDPLTAVKVADPSHGAVTLNSDGSFTYNPTSGYVGPDSFTYKANDGGLDSNVVAVSITVTAAPINLVVNGSFENGAVVSGQVTALDNWTVTGSPIGYIKDSVAPLYYTATDGNRLAVLNGGGNAFGGELKQVNLSTTIGQAYRLDFDAGIFTAPQSLAARTQTLRYQVIGNATLRSGSVPLSANIGVTNWQSFSFTFVADSTSTMLVFDDSLTTADQADSSDMLLDKVRISPIDNARTLTVSSSPVSALAITASPSDLAGLGDGTTSFTRSYADNTAVTLTATQYSGVNVFQKWQKNGSDFTTNLAAIVTMDAAISMNAVYVVDNSPRAIADSYSTNEDTQLVVAGPGVLGNDTEPNSLPITAVIDTPPAHGSFTLDPDGGFTYNPTGNYAGPDSFTYHATNGSLNSGIATVSLTVTQVNDGATAVAQSVSTNEDVPLPITLAGTDPENDTLSFAIVASPAHGTFSGSGANLTYTPTANYNGPDSFTFTVDDGSGASAAATVTIDVVSVPDMPVANAQSFSDVTRGATQEITLTGSDGDGDTLTYTVTGNPLNGVLTGTPPNLTYIPNQTYEGADSFTFVTNDGTSDSAPATISITVNAIIKNGGFQQVTGLVPDFWTITSSNAEAAHYEIAETSTNRPARDGTKLAVLNAANLSPNAVFSQTFKTRPGYPYVLTFDRGIQAFNTNTQKIKVTVTGATVLVSPAEEILTGNGTGESVWGSKSYTFTANSPTTTVKFEDKSAPNTFILDLLLDKVAVTPVLTRTLTVDSTPDIGVTVSSLTPLDINGAGGGFTTLSRVFLAQPTSTTVSLSVPAVIGAMNFQKWTKNGVDFSVNPSTSVLMDADYTLNAAYIPNQAPVTVADAYSTDEDTQLVVPVAGVLGNDSDPESLALTAVVDVAPTQGTLVLNSNGSFSYTPAANYSGPVTFTYRASDGVVQSEVTTVTITVNPVNDAPVATAQAVSVSEDGSVAITLTGTDQEGSSLTFANGSASNGVITGTAPNLTYTPTGNYNGPDSFTFTANDGDLPSAPGTVSITVSPVNDPPTATAQSVSVDEDGTLAFVLAGVDVDGDTLTFVAGSADHGMLTGTAPNLTYTPTANYNGPDSFTFTVNDGSGATAPATVSITVNPIDDAPVAIAQSVMLNEDGTLAITLTGSDQEGSSLTFANGAASNGQLTGTAPNLTYTPTADYYGADSFTFTVNDGSLTSAPGTVVIRVDPINDAPSASAQSVSVDEDGSVAITLAGVDVDGDSLIFAAGSVSNGMLTGSAPNLTYTPTANYNGPASFTFTVNDGFGASAPATVSITVNPINDVPVAAAQAVSVDEDGSVAITLTGSDQEGSTLTFANGSASNGQLTGTAPNLTFTPTANYNGPASFTFTVSDGTAISDPATVSITVNPVNDAPTATAQAVSVDEDGSVAITLAGVDVDGDSLTYANGPVSNGQLTGTAPNLTYTPTANYNGPDSFTFTVNDGSGATVPATVSITVNPINDVPVAAAQAVSVDEDGSVAITLTGSDQEGSTLTFANGSASNGQLTGIAPNLTFTPTANYNGPASFTFTVSDGTDTSVPATVSITVNPINDTPTATAQAVSVDEDGSVAITLAGVDVDGDSLTFVEGSVSHGALTGSAPNLTYTPTANYNGPDSFTFTVNDGSGATAPATVSITVNPINDVPVAAAQAVSVDEDGSVAITLTGSDQEGSTLTFANGSASNGQLTGTAPNLTFTPTANYNGPASFTFTVNDGTDTSVPATVSITVNPINDVPTATAQAVSVDEDGSVAITLAGVDVDGDSLTYANGPVSNGQLTGTAPNLTFTPTANYNGPDSFTFTVNDGSGSTAPATVSITVNPINDVPVAAAQAVSVDEDGSVAITLTGSDQEGSTLTFANGSASNGQLTGTAPNLTFTPTANYNGPASFTFTVSDGTAISDPATVSITVNPINDVPVAAAQAVSVDEDGSVAITLTGSDQEGSTLTFANGSASNGQLTGTAPNLTFTPTANYNGPASFTFTVNDGTDTSDPATVSITVNPINDAPVATAQAVSVDEDGSVAITLAGVDVDGDSLTFVEDSVSHGALTGTAPNLTYTPTANYNGPDSFTFTVNDGSGATVPATVSITVNPINDVPLAAAQAVSVDEDGSVAITLTGSDQEGSTLTFANGSASNGQLTGIAPNLMFTPTANYNGPASFTFTVSDGTDTSVPATVSITVNSISDAPTATPQLVSVNEDGSVAITLAGVDGDGDSLTFVEGSVSHGALTGTAPNLTYTPTANYNGPDSFTFTVNDGSGATAPATVSITVNPINDVPVAAAQAVSVNEDGSVAITLAGVDADGDSLTYANDSVSNGQLTGSAPNLTFTPTANYNGPASFTFTVSDGTAISDPATVSITVNPINDVPVAAAQAVSVDEDGSVAITLTGSDQEGSTLTFANGSASNGQLTGTAPNLTFTPTANYNGPASFTFTVNDGTDTSVPATVSITVNPINDTPTAIAQAVSVNEDGAVAITLTGSDQEGSTLTYARGSVSNGLLWGIAPNLFYTPAANYNGPASFTFTVSDGTATSAPATVSITVNPINDVPVAAAQAVSVNEDGSVAITLTGSDQEGSTLTFANGSASNGQLTGTAPNLTFTPTANYNGPASFTFTVNDGTDTSVPATVSITVNPINDAPTAIAQSVSVDEDGSVAITLAGVDADGDSLTFANGPASNGQLTGTAPNLTFTPTANYNGPASFTFTVNDGSGASAPATVSITVNPVNDAPVAVTNSYSTDENTTLNVAAPGVLGNDADQENSALTAILVADAAHGDLTLGSDGSILYLPDSGFDGQDSFTYKAKDGDLESNTVTVTINVNNVVPEFTEWLAEFGLVANPETDSDRDSITNAVEFVIGGNPANQSNTNLLPTVSLADPNGNTVNPAYYLFTYRRTARANADPLTTIHVEWDTDLIGAWTKAASTLGVVTLVDTDGFETGVDRVKVYLPRTLSTNGSMFIRLAVDIDVPPVIVVPPVNGAPVAQPQSVTVNEDSSVPVTLAGTDANSDPLTYTVVTPPLHGTLTGTGANRTYTPFANYQGSDSFTFKVNDGTEDSVPATVSITVTSLEEINQWLATFSLTASPQTDSDGDSISNAVEWVIGGNPANQSNSAMLPVVSLVTADPDQNSTNADYLLFTYRRTSLAKNDPSTTINVQWSASPAGFWANANGTPGVVTVEEINAAGAGIDLVKVYIPRSLSSEGRLFARLGVAVNTP